MEELFNQTVVKDLDNLNELVRKGWYGTTDFDEAVSKLQFALGVYLEERNEGNQRGECLPKSQLAKGA